MIKLLRKIFLGERTIYLPKSLGITKKALKGYYSIEISSVEEQSLISFRLHGIFVPAFIGAMNTMALIFLIASIANPSETWQFYGAIGLFVAAQGIMFILFPKEIRTGDWDLSD
jgi:hypothetical protein